MHVPSAGVHLPCCGNVSTVSTQDPGPAYAPATPWMVAVQGYRGPRAVDSDVGAQDLAPLCVSLTEGRIVDVDRPPPDLRRRPVALFVDNLSADYDKPSSGGAECLAHADARQVSTDVVWLIDEVAQVGVVVLSPVLAIDLHTTERKHPAGERRSKLVIVRRAELVLTVPRAQGEQQFAAGQATLRPGH